MIILLNQIISPLRNVQVPLVGEVSVGVEPVRMISGGVGSPPTLHRGIYTTCCIYYGLFRDTHAYGRSLTPGIVGASQGWER